MASEAFAEPTIVARGEHLTVRIAVGARAVARGLGKRLVAQILASPLEERRCVRNLIRWLRVLVRTLSLEGIAASLNLTAQVARLARGTKRLVELVVVGLELIIGHAPVLDGGILRQDPRAVALYQVAAVLEEVRQKP